MKHIPWCQVNSNSNDCIGIVLQYIITVELATQKLCMNEYVSLHHVLVSHVWHYSDNYLTTMHWNRRLAISQIWHTQDARRANHVICRCVLVSCTMAINNFLNHFSVTRHCRDYHPTNVTKHWACRREVLKYTSWRIIREVSCQLSYI